MCLAIPGKILKIEDNTGIVEIMGVTREVSLELLNNIKAGDYVLVHAGCAIETVDEKEALKTIKIFKELQDFSNEQ